MNGCMGPRQRLFRLSRQFFFSFFFLFSSFFNSRFLFDSLSLQSGPPGPWRRFACLAPVLIGSRFVDLEMQGTPPQTSFMLRPPHRPRTRRLAAVPCWALQEIRSSNNNWLTQCLLVPMLACSPWPKRCSANTTGNC